MGPEGVRVGRVAVAIAGVSAVLSLAAPAGAQDYGFEFGGPDRPDPERLELAASSVAVDADGNPWVADPGKGRIVKFGYDGTYIAEFTAIGGIALGSPTGLAADAQGTVYVALGSPQVVKLDTAGRPAGTLELADEAGLPLRVSKLAVDDATGRIFATDGSPRVDVFDRTGTRVGRLPLFPGGVNDVAVSGGRVAVTHDSADPSADGFAVYSTDLRLVTQFPGTPGVALEEAAFDPAGRVLLVDPFAQIFRRIDVATRAEERLGTPGLGPGQTNGPTGIAADCRGNIYVLDGAARFDTDPVDIPGSKVLKFTVPADPPPCAPRPAPDRAGGTQVNDVEVTQAVQPPFGYIADAGARTRTYGQTNGGAPTGEVGLKAGLPTVVRVYANLADGPAGGLSNIPATLEGLAAGGRSLGVLQPVGRPSILRIGDRLVDPALRSQPAAAYSFELPAEWTRQGTITLVARVNPAGAGGCDAACLERSTFRLGGVSFGPTKLVRIAPIALTSGGRRPFAEPSRAFSLAQRVTPMRLEVWGWQADVEVGDLLNTDAIRVEDCFLGIFPCSEDTYSRGSPEFRAHLQGQLMDRLEDVADDRDIRGCDRIAIGLAPQNQNLPGAMRGELQAAGFLPCALGYAAVHRPLTAVAHEVHHALGRPHAGQNCPGTGDGDDQEGETWAPDNRGLLAGIGLNTTRRSLSARGPFDILAAGVAPNAGELFDLMSYCGDESSAWVSPRNWAQLSTWRLSDGPIASAISATGLQRGERLLRVSALQFASGKLGVTGVSPADAAAGPVDPASPYVVEAMDAAGTVLAAAPAAGDPLPDGGGVIITGTVAAPAGTTQVFVRRGREAGTRRVASPNAPRLRLLAPTAGVRVAGGTLQVRWNATDADGGELSARVEFSGDGGRTWTTVQAGPSRGRVAVPRTLLSGSRRARVRVRVDDGFNAATATSPVFTVVAPPPVVTISSPEGALRLAADTPLTLTGTAVGPLGRPLPASGLRWFDGQRALGRGSSVTVASLSPGRHRLRLVARAGGATGTATRVVTVQGVRPLFLLRRVPAALPRGARSVRLRVASTVAATLVAGGRRFTVGPRATTVVVPVARGTRAVSLRLTLRAGRLQTTETVRIARR